MGERWGKYGDKKGLFDYGFCMLHRLLMCPRKSVHALSVRAQDLSSHRYVYTSDGILNPEKIGEGSPSSTSTRVSISSAAIFPIQPASRFQKSARSERMTPGTGRASKHVHGADVRPIGVTLDFGRFHPLGEGGEGKSLGPTRVGNKNVLLAPRGVSSRLLTTTRTSTTGGSLASYSVRGIKVVSL